MKRLICIIKPFKLDPVLNALTELGIDDVTITEVRGYGRQKGHLELYHGSEYSITFLPKVKLEFSVEPDQLQTVISKVTESARTGRIGDGKIFVLEGDGY